MKKVSRILITVAALAGLIALPPGPAQASHHLVRITEVFLGTPGAPEAEFVELKAFSGGQNQFTSNGAVVKLYGTTGNLVATADFLGNPNDFAASQKYALVATTEAETFFGVDADANFTAAELNASAAACFESSTNGKIDCVSWGGFIGSDSTFHAGKPINPNEGIPHGASITRMEGENDQLDSGDDSDNSKNDFRLDTPRPQGGGDPTNDPPRIELTADGYGTSEDSGEVGTAVEYQAPAENASFGVQFETVNGSAKSGDDYEGVAEGITFLANDREESEPITLIDDDTHEGSEIFKVRVREPTDGAVLGDSINGTVVISDNEDDHEAPVTRLRLPKQGETYAPSAIEKIKGKSDDGLGDLGSVDVGLRKTLANGNCKWLVAPGGDQAFQPGACDKRKFVQLFTGTFRWVLTLDDHLVQSKSGKVAFYTAYARATDSANNKEKGFEKGRNANKFEVQKV